MVRPASRVDHLFDGAAGIDISTIKHAVVNCQAISNNGVITEQRCIVCNLMVNGVTIRMEREGGHGRLGAVCIEPEWPVLAH